MLEENPKRLKKFKGFAQKCCYGVSVYTDETSVVNAFKKFPEGIGDRLVAKGVVSSDDGKMMNTGAPDASHHTLWLVNGNETHKKFSCIRGLVK